MNQKAALRLAVSDYTRAFVRGDVVRIDDALSRVEEIRAAITSAHYTAPCAQVIPIHTAKKSPRCCKTFVRRGRDLVQVAG